MKKYRCEECEGNHCYLWVSEAFDDPEAFSPKVCPCDKKNLDAEWRRDETQE